MSVYDTNYCFTLSDIGQYGSNNDSGVLNGSEMGKKLSAVEMNLPELENLSVCPSDPVPFYLLDDGIFPLKNWLMRPHHCKMLQEDQFVYSADTLVQNV